MNMKTISSIPLLLLLLVIAPLCTYSQSDANIKPIKSSSGEKWGYQDALGNWVIQPQFYFANEFDNNEIAIVIIEKGKNAESIYDYSSMFIDLNGNPIIKYRSSVPHFHMNKRYDEALKTVMKRKVKGLYDDVYRQLAKADSIINQKILQDKREQEIIQEREQARQDSILMVQREQKRLADSIMMVKKRRTDSIRQAQENRINAMPSLEEGISLHKIKVTGHGLLLSKDKTWREYTIRMDDFNRILITYEGNTRVRGELDVLKVIYESDWKLLSDDLFHSVEIAKATTEISRGARTKKFGVFSFLFTLNLDDLDKVFTDEETLLTVQNSISQIERYITSFINHYKGAAHIVEPLFQMHPNDRSGISVGIIEKQGSKEGIEIGNAKRMCAEARKKLDAKKAIE
ncbi:WG repeat-containing protein [Dysgonomonas sp. BGC7]|uniref:WG repeat-containing protein n=2 Tax=Dysgonomonas sp. BGC7 TaxID=1658008 RepID=UPI000A9DA193|nr:WG repeat-containing protein [Dysgonomonas sp. BGC7]MBD8387926.1 WG repeat-containing protein [Dysgonomonas sp. BGC7]